MKGETAEEELVLTSSSGRGKTSPSGPSGKIAENIRIMTERGWSRRSSPRRCSPGTPSSPPSGKAPVALTDGEAVAVYHNGLRSTSAPGTELVNEVVKRLPPGHARESGSTLCSLRQRRPAGGAVPRCSGRDIFQHPPVTGS
jgi:hypothetical protein